MAELVRAPDRWSCNTGTPIRDQALGLAYAANDLGRAGAGYETYLDRKLERTLAMSIRLRVRGDLFGKSSQDQDAIAALIRDTVPFPTPITLATFLTPSPAARRARMAASTLAPVLGRPSRTPRAFARSKPAIRLSLGCFFFYVFSMEYCPDFPEVSQGVRFFVQRAAPYGTRCGPREEASVSTGQFPLNSTESTMAAAHLRRRAFFLRVDGPC